MTHGKDDAHTKAAFLPLSHLSTDFRPVHSTMGNACRVVYRPDPEQTSEYYCIFVDKEKVTKANLLCGPT
jgi:hypothetical protein